MTYPDQQGKVTVVWNPGEETAATMPDIAEGSYQEFVCVEAVNAYNDTITINPGAEHTTATFIGLDHKASGLRLGDRNGGFSVV